MKIASVLASIALLANSVSAGICAGVAPYSYQVAVQTNSQFQPAIDELKKHPVATWYVDNGGDQIDALLAACPSDTPVIVVYGLPGKDCAAGFSGGGNNKNADDYKNWVQKLATKVGNRKVIYILEPDAIGLLSNNNCAVQNGYEPNLKVAMQILSSNSNAQIYADVAAWSDQGKAVSILKGLGKVSGIAINTSNYKSTGEMNTLCQTYSSATGGLHCIIDTSRNFNGSPQNEWCNAKSAGIGAPPTSDTKNPLVDYYLWLKVPGESDGQCYGQSSDALIGPGAGQFFAQGFQLLWDQGYFVANGAAKIGENPKPTTAPAPTQAPTSAPTSAPTQAPTNAPTNTPTSHPTDYPTQAPTNAPTQAPTDAPTQAPTNAPTSHPTQAPTNSPTSHPTDYPTDAPTSYPTNAPTQQPTTSPTQQPTTKPTKKPTFRPTTKPGTDVDQWGQCGGLYYKGSTTCVAGCNCFKVNDYFSHCRPNEVKEDVVAPYNQCGGKNYKGNTTCSEGWTCKVQNEFYSQCVKNDNNNDDSSDSQSSSDDVYTMHIRVHQYRWQCVVDAVAIVYAITSVGLSFVSLQYFATLTDTDYMWPHFSNAAPLLSEMVNRHLALLPNTPLNLTSPMSALINISTGIDSVYPRMIMYEELTTLESAVIGLRALDASQVGLMDAPYCWADFNRVYELAYTARRQERCNGHYQANAALHMEAVLRNIDFATWREVSQGKFDSSIGLPIDGLDAAGSKWFESLVNHQIGSVAEEVGLWQSHGLNHFTLEYTTVTGIGIQEAITVSTAMWMEVSYPLKSIQTTYRVNFMTSSIFYDLLVSDFYVLSPNQTFLRNTPEHFENSGDPSVMECSIIGCPLNMLATVIHNQIGILGAIDAFWLPPPQWLRQFIAKFQQQLSLELSTTAAIDFMWPDALLLNLHPVRWSSPDLVFYGGNPMCTDIQPSIFVQQTFSFDDTCTVQVPLTLHWTPVHCLFALQLLGDNFDKNFCQHMSNEKQSKQCSETYWATKALYNQTAFEFVDDKLVPELEQISLAIMQFVARNSTTEIEVQPLLEPSFRFLGAMMLFDWGTNQREVLSIQGDFQTLNLMSAMYDKVQMPKPPKMAAVAPYFWYFASFTSYTLLLVLALVIFVWIVRRPPCNALYMLNPIASSVWLNRNFLVARGLVGILCLATVPVDTTTGIVTRFVHINPRPILLSGLLAGEALWILFVLHEVFLPLVQYANTFVISSTVFVAWLSIVILDQMYPLDITSNIHRSCTSKNMDFMLICSSGSVNIGYPTRVIVIGIILLSSFLLTLSCLYWRQCRRKMILTTNPLFPPVVRVIDYQLPLNSITFILCGVFRIPYRQSNYVFDIRLWRLVSSATHELTTQKLCQPPLRSVTSDIKQLIPLQPARRIAHVILLIGALIYLLATLGGNVAYLSVLKQSLANDFGWAGFTTGTQVFLAQAFLRLSLGNISMGSIAFDTPGYGDIAQIFNSSNATPINWYPGVPRRQLLNSNGASLENIVKGLRDMDPCQLPWMFTQYCWLDFNQKWEMASTSARQSRCYQQYRENGAVYLEAPLRNMDSWQTWEICWGSSFNIGFATELTKTLDGVEWLDAVANNYNSIDDEVKDWKQHGIHNFVLQWQNYKTTGWHDAFSITTALGFTYSLTTSNSPNEIHVRRQTSFRMYWTFASDLWAISQNTSRISGHSLLRSSSQFAFQNITPTMLLFDNKTIQSPLQTGLSIVSSTIGPFGCVDMKYLMVPSGLLRYFEALNLALRTTLSTDMTAQERFLALPIKSMIGELPLSMKNESILLNAGGDIMCGSDLNPVPLYYSLTSFFSFNSHCSHWLTEYITPTNSQLFFALLGFNLNHEIDEEIDFIDFCNVDWAAEPNCNAIYKENFNFAKTYNLTAIVPNIEDDLRSLNISIVQFLFNSANNNTFMYLRNILDTTEERSWIFFGWCLLYDWILTKREVVAFEGDIGTISIISSASSPLSFTVDSSEIPTELSYGCQACAQYVTVILIGITSIVFAYTIASFGKIEPLNLFELNRIVGHVWIGRLLLLGRSATALWLLNTSSLNLVQYGQATLFTAPNLPWYKIALASSELTWLVYVLNDVISFLTLQYTPYYAPKSAFVAWLFSVIVSFQKPHKYQALIQRTCLYYNMDTGLDCTTGQIKIGDFDGIIRDLLIVGGAVIGTVLFERWRRPKLPPIEIQTLLLSSSSYYALDFTYWQDTRGSVCIDYASALMAGLITLPLNGRIYIFDVKSWRFYQYAPNDHFWWVQRRAIFLHRVVLE